MASNLTWGLVGNIKGDPGPQGPGGPGPPGPAGPAGPASEVPGAQGPRGSLWFYGNGAPSGISAPLPNDLYLDQVTTDVWAYKQV